MGSSGTSQGPPQTTTQISEPPEYVKGPATRFLSRAEDLSQQPFTTYSGDRISPLTPTHQYALNAGRQSLATQIPQANNTMANFASGAFNRPAYIHPWVGPSVPGIGMSHPYGGGGKGGAMQPPQQGPGPAQQTQIPQAAAPTPVEAPPFYQAPTGAPSVGGVAQQTTQGYNDPGAFSPQDTGPQAYFDDLVSWGSNLAFTPFGGLAHAAYGLTQPDVPPAMTTPQNFFFNHNNHTAGVSSPNSFDFGDTSIDAGDFGLDADDGIGGVGY